MRIERARQLVGRDLERARFAAMLDGSSAAAILWIHGPGGVGKTTLMARLRDDAEAAGRAVVVLDARDLDPTPAAFFTALARALACDADAVPDRLATAPHVLCVDTYELVADLDGWMRTDLVPTLPDGTLVVLAGREPPGPWRLDPGLAGLVEVVALRNLTPEQSREVLARRGITGERQVALAGVTHGHPLALVLVAELAADTAAAGFRLDDAPDVVEALLDCLVRRVPTPEHRKALMLTAMVASTTEELLRAVFDAQAPALYDWLRGLSFIERGARGIFPHDIAREVLDSDLRRRDSETYRALNRAAHAYHAARLDAERDRHERHRTMIDWLFLFRSSPILRQVIDFSRLGSVIPRPLVEEELAPALGLVLQRIGPRSMEIVRGWHERVPGAFLAYHDEHGELAAITVESDLDVRSLTAVAEIDPAMAAIHDQIRSHGGLRDGEVINVSRILVARLDGPDARPYINDLQARNAARWMSPPRLAWSFLVGDARAWVPEVVAFTEHRRVELPGCRFDGLDLIALAHDWRAMPPRAWIELLGERALSLATDLAQLARPAASTVIALSEDEFREAVRQALKDLPFDDALSRNPLVRSRVVRDGGADADATALRALLERAARTLQTSPHGDKLFRALDATYLTRAETQELAAERLALPFSTYRRHLATAIDRITEWLWQRETGGT